ncbi:glucose dehydrogenase [FAD, quinone]-like [Adelges cooleyi]|uniref:glucose dehydrogenase [FAD, quinone]-like n=1 Tax=Adelges cooleyi TaxID=133065 RepID=UPI0021806B59|nr:glucose dehydrogenase [FAD, quinone]-like [Adelges cooleyi]XP_050421957.1 glucose dehydrogenase [FAD, quinone]-like [Adelges cooleyi]
MYAYCLYLLYALLANIFTGYLILNYYYNIALDKYVENHPTTKYFDHIVVGAGTAGIAVASRLAENGAYSVLLLEAGPRVSSLHDIPLTTSIFQKSIIDWQHQTEPQAEACLALNNRSSQWPTGKVLGGTSRINFNIHLRGHVSTDYLNWQSGHEWSRDDVLHYFKKYEMADMYFGSPIKKQKFFSQRPTHTTPVATTILEAAEELGYTISQDMNSDDFRITGTDSGSFSFAPVATKFGYKTSSEHLYLKKKSKQNLVILTNAEVKKVMFRNNYEARGVVYSKFGKSFKVFASKSIVISAGALNTPKILMNSGVGPVDQLKPLKIPLVADLPVGENLQDHIITGMDMIVLNKSLGLTFLHVTSPLNMYKYVFEGTGIWTHPGCEAIGLIRLPSKDNNSNSSPDLQIMLLPFGITSDAGSLYLSHSNLKRDKWDEYFKPLVGKQVITLGPVLLHPKSTGHVKLNSNRDIVIQPNYLKNKQDVRILIEGMKLVKKFSQTKALSKFGAQLYEKPFPGCNKHNFGSDRYWECYVRHITFTSHHPVGTCKMGNINEKSVVDHSLRVHNLNNLYVIDASIMPSMPSGNTNAVVAMIAEKGADLIKKHCFERKQKCNVADFFKTN